MSIYEDVTKGKIFPNLTEDDISRIWINPFYAIQVDGVFCKKHEFMATEEQWIKLNLDLIKEIGKEEWLKLLLDVLKGNYK